MLQVATKSVITKSQQPCKVSLLDSVHEPHTYMVTSSICKESLCRGIQSILLIKEHVLWPNFYGESSGYSLALFLVIGCIDTKPKHTTALEVATRVPGKKRLLLRSGTLGIRSTYLILNLSKSSQILFIIRSAQGLHTKLLYSSFQFILNTGILSVFFPFFSHYLNMNWQDLREYLEVTWRSMLLGTWSQ